MLPEATLIFESGNIRTNLIFYLRLKINVYFNLNIKLAKWGKDERIFRWFPHIHFARYPCMTNWLQCWLMFSAVSLFRILYPNPKSIGSFFNLPIFHQMYQNIEMCPKVSTQAISESVFNLPILCWFWYEIYINETEKNISQHCHQIVMQGLCEKLT